MPLTLPTHALDLADNPSTLLAMDAGNLPSVAHFPPLPQATVAPQTIATILLVEDNDSLREMTEILLTVMGYRVIACDDAQSASEAFLTDTSAGSINLLLTDLEMPGRSGIELARELTRLRPSLPVVIVSGSLISTDLEREMRAQNWKFIGKPFRLPHLIETLQALIPSVPEAAA